MKHLFFILFAINIASMNHAMEPQICQPAHAKAHDTQHVKESSTYPKLIVFDFHGTLSLDTTGAHKISALKDRLKKFNNNEFKAPLTAENWHTLMMRAAAQDNLKSEDMVPRLNDLITFISDIDKRTSNNTKFAIASNLEQDSFIIAMMKYAFENQGMQNINPFNDNTVVGTQGLLKYGPMPQGEGKLKHIAIILKNLGLHIQKDLQYSDIVLIDNSGDDLAKVQTAGVKPIKVDQYFRVDEWNHQYK